MELSYAPIVGIYIVVFVYSSSRRRHHFILQFYT